MKDNKGFTLIELLAVIVVLAVILSIAVPGITGIIRNATKKAFNSDAKMVIQAIEYKKLNNSTFNPLEITKENMIETIGLSSTNYEQVNLSLEGNNIKIILVGANKWDGFTAYGTIRNMTVVDSGDYDAVPPAITILGDNPANVGRGTVYVDAGATAIDLKDGPVALTSVVIRNASNVVVSNIDTSTFTTYTITYTAIDNNNNETSSVRRINIVDRTKPILTLLGDNPTTVDVNGVYSDAGATATDDVDGDITSNIVVTGSVNPSIVGTYTITYTISDSSNNTTTISRTINVVDNVLPTVVFGTNGNATYAKGRSTIVTVSDNVLVNTSSLKYLWDTSTTTPTEASFSTSFTNGETLSTPVGVTGGYYLWILGKDASNNIAIVRSNAFNLDNTLPVITMNGNASVTVNKGGVYSDAGATAIDNISTGLVVTSSGTINANIVGTYTITYTVSDSSGNAAIPVIRTINVIDVSAPVITILGSNPMTINIGSNYSDAGATALDDVDDNVTSRIVTTGTVNPNVAGTYTITYTVKDNANNQAVASRTVNVVDNVIPTVAFGMNGNATYAKSRSTTVTVSDNVLVNTSSLKYLWNTSTTAPTEASFTTAFSNGGTLSTPAGVTGSYYLWILGKDTAGNTMIAGSNAFNLDNVIPVLTLVGNSNILITLNSSYGDYGATATDNINGTISGSIVTTGTVNTTVVGTYTITYNVSDSSGNAAIPITRTVQVVNVENNYAYTGGVQTMIVPQGVTKVQLEVWGAQGGTTSQWGGSGGYAKGLFDVTPGQTLYIYVGGANSGEAGGWNGGGNAGGYYAYGGGGATDIRLNGMALTDRIIVAGGGGGAAEYGGGNGGGLSGTNVYDGIGGYGGTQTAGGAGGGSAGYGGGAAGSLGVGGRGGCIDYCGGGGGGGYYGGGGGNGSYSEGAKGGGGGGSGYIKAGATLTSMQTGGHGGNGAAKIYLVNSVDEFAYTGTIQQLVANTSKVMIEVWGAQGGTTSQWGGLGGYSKGIFTVTPGQTMYIYVGQQPTGTTGGWNGGGNAGGYYGLGGGGATDVRLGGTTLSNRIIIAGGGGGAAEYGGGNGGGLSGTNVYDGIGGYGGTQTTGGAGGGSAGYGGGSAGSLGVGGNGGCIDYCGGGGGGGYYGGGGGNGSYSEGAKGGGGGGSGYIQSGATTTDSQTGVRSGHGFVRITGIS